MNKLPSPLSLSAAIGTAIRNERINAKMSQRELASKSKITQTTISKIETGSGNVTVVTIQRILDTLGSHIELTLYK